MSEQVLPQITLTGLPAEGLDPDRVLGSAYMQYRAGVITEAGSMISLANPATAEAMETTLTTMAGRYLNLFRFTAGVAFRRIILESFESHGVTLSEQDAAQRADDMAMNAGSYFASSSANAVMDVYHRLVNQKVPPGVAAQRAIESFGLNAPQARTLASLAADKPVMSSEPGAVWRKALVYIDKSWLNRLGVLIANTIRQVHHESVMAAWVKGVEDGTIPDTAQKIWVTAADERVCPVCGPMDGRSVQVLDQFLLPDGAQADLPPVHVNCRCSVELTLEPWDDIAKAWDPKLHPRGAKGEFGTKGKPVLEAEMKPEVRAIFDQVERRVQNSTPNAQKVQRVVSARPVSNRPQAQKIVAARPVRTAVPVLAPARSQVVLNGQAFPVTRLSMTHRMQVAANTAANVKHHAVEHMPALPPAELLHSVGPQYVAFATQRDLNAEGGKAHIMREILFVDQNDTIQVQSALNESMRPMDNYLRTHDFDGPFADAENAQDEGVRHMAVAMRMEMGASANSRSTGDLRVSVAPEDAMEAWRAILSPTGSGYRSMFPVSVIDKHGNEVSRPVLVDSHTVAALTGLRPDDDIMPQVVSAPYGVWGPDLGVGETRKVGENYKVSGPYNYEVVQGGTVHLIPDPDAFERAYGD